VAFLVHLIIREEVIWDSAHGQVLFLCIIFKGSMSAWAGAGADTNPEHHLLRRRSTTEARQ